MSAEELTTSLNNDEEAANKTGCKRKRNQISLFEYFSKRKKSQSQDSSMFLCFVMLIIGYCSRCQGPLDVGKVQKEAFCPSRW